MVKIISDDSYKTHAFIDDVEISDKATSIHFEQNAGEVPIFTFETVNLPNIEIENADIRFRFAPETIEDSAKVIRHSFLTDKVLYDAFVASIEGAIYENGVVCDVSDQHELALEIANRIIGVENELQKL